MSEHLSLEELEAIALGQASSAHVDSCPECARELAWARAERELLVRRPSPSTDALWAGVAERISPNVVPLRRRSVVRRFGVAVAATLSAAAALLVVIERRGGPAQDVAMTEADDPVDAKALAALDKAEGEVHQATTVLEAEYREARARLKPAEAQKWDATLARARGQFGSAQQPLDVQARLRVLDGQADYLRSLRMVVASTGSPD